LGGGTIVKERNAVMTLGFEKRRRTFYQAEEERITNPRTKKKSKTPGGPPEK